MMLAHPYRHDIDPTGWIISEKLDGVRAYWDGEKLITRLGNKIHAPDWFTKDFPKTHLDGELWCGRGEFQKTVSIVRSHDAGDAWNDVIYMVFDAPKAEGGFMDRLYAVDYESFSNDAPIIPVTQVVCEGPEHLDKLLELYLSVGAEGLMLRKADSLYEDGRSWNLLKCKAFHDAEALVLGYTEGSGKHKGKLGALVVQTVEGKKFKVGTGFTDEERLSPPPVGSTITYRYQELTKDGVPRFPVFLRIRSDATL